jgi:hypothetical protein
MIPKSTEDNLPAQGDRLNAFVPELEYLYIFPCQKISDIQIPIDRQ